jgi:hypothetical protein
MEHEPGTSLRAAGWTFADRVEVKDIHWDRRGADHLTTTAKQRWGKALGWFQSGAGVESFTRCSKVDNL